MKDFKIATCQMNVVDNKDTNIEKNKVLDKEG